jgi:hypothetical protein
MVTLHSPAVEENSIGPSGPWTVNESALSALVGARLTNDVPDRCSCWTAPPLHVMSIGAGGGAQTAGVSIEERPMLIVMSPDRVTLAAPTTSGLSGPGDPDGVGETVGVGDAPSGGGGETVSEGPWPIPLVVHAAVRTVRSAPSARVRSHVPRIPASLPHASRPTRTYAGSVSEAPRERLPGSVPATVAAGLTFATAAVYVAIIISQGDVDIGVMIGVTAYLAGLGVAALAGAIRPRPDRVIPLGIASGGLVGAAVVSLFSIGLLLLVAGVFAVVAWTRAGVGASSRDQLLGGIGGAIAAFAFLLLVIVL